MDDIQKITDLLKKEQRGLNIREIAEKLKINRNSIAKLLDILTAKDEIEKRVHGRSKVYYVVPDCNKKIQDYKKSFELLSGTIEKLNNFSPEEDIYAFIAGILSQIAPEDTIIFVNSFNQDTKIITIQAFEGLGPLQSDVEKIISKPFKGLSFSVPDRVLPEMLTGECNEISGGLIDLTFGMLPYETCKKIEAMLSFGKVYSAGISWNGKLNGAATFILPKGSDLENRELITFFIRQVAGFLSRRQSETALIESEQFTREIIDSAKEGIIVRDRDLNYLIWNPFMEYLTGISASEVLGKNALELFPHLLDGKMDVMMQRALMGETVRIPDMSFHNPSTRKSGWISCIYSPHSKGDGEIDGVIGIITDLTERKQVEEDLAAAFTELKISEERFSAAFHSSAALMGLSSGGKFLDVNQTFLKTLGFSRDEIIGKSISDLDLFMNPEDRALALRMLEESSKVRNLEVPVRTKDGSIQHGLFSIDQIIIGEIPCLLTTMVDITEQKILEKEMEFHEQEILRFSRSLDTAIRKLNLLSRITRHDINNQLTAILGYLDMLEIEQNSPLLNPYLKTVRSAAIRISTMIQFAKTYESIGTVEPIWQDIRNLVTTAAEETSRGTIVLENDIPAGAEVFADPLIVKVFYNLMDNAVRYGGKITTIRFSVDEKGDRPVIMCDDDGDGIPQEEKEKVFEHGYGKNTGLGLFLSRDILDITGITIRETGEPGKGARFEIAVPGEAFQYAGIR
jgi:PAS domain S-box-containing protein